MVNFNLALTGSPCNAHIRAGGDHRCSARAQILDAEQYQPQLSPGFEDGRFAFISPQWA